MKKNNQGITLIALVITIIVLLILAGISIATLTGENGILTKASEAERQTDIKDTKEQIKIELMGMLDEKGNNYTNSDVIGAVEKITGEKVAENTAVVQSKKGNEVDISDLWLPKERTITFSISTNYPRTENDTETYQYTVSAGAKWTEEFISGLNPSLNDIIAMSSWNIEPDGSICIIFPGNYPNCLELNGELVHIGDLVEDGGQYVANF